jgi:hypothetical protein
VRVHFVVLGGLIAALALYQVIAVNWQTGGRTPA